MSTTKKSTRKATATRTTTATKRAAKKSTAKKAGARKSTAKKSTAKKASARKTAAKSTGARKSTARKAPVRKSPAKRAPAAKSAAKSAGQYTKPELRERLKARIMRGTKGGQAGQWSARKAQLLAQAYESEGGGYKGGKSSTQRHLQEWTHEEWTTSDGKRARRASGTTRYLPTKAWSKLSASEKAATNRKKVEGSRRGTQHVANTTRAKHARRTATHR